MKTILLLFTVNYRMKNSPNTTTLLQLIGKKNEKLTRRQYYYPIIQYDSAVSLIHPESCKTEMFREIFPSLVQTVANMMAGLDARKRCCPKTLGADTQGSPLLHGLAQESSRVHWEH